MSQHEGLVNPHNNPTNTGVYTKEYDNTDKGFERTRYKSDLGVRSDIRSRAGLGRSKSECVGVSKSTSDIVRQLEIEKLRSKVSSHGNVHWRKSSAIYRPCQIWKSDSSQYLSPKTYQSIAASYVSDQDGAGASPSPVPPQDKELARSRARALRRYRRHSVQYDSSLTDSDNKLFGDISNNSQFHSSADQVAPIPSLISKNSGTTGAPVSPGPDLEQARSRARSRRRFRRYSLQIDTGTSSGDLTDVDSPEVTSGKAVTSLQFWNSKYLNTDTATQSKDTPTNKGDVQDNPISTRGASNVKGSKHSGPQVEQSLSADIRAWLASNQKALVRRRQNTPDHHRQPRSKSNVSPVPSRDQVELTKVTQSPPSRDQRGIPSICVTAPEGQRDSAATRERRRRHRDILGLHTSTQTAPGQQSAGDHTVSQNLASPGTLRRRLNTPDHQIKAALADPSRFRRYSLQCDSSLYDQYTNPEQRSREPPYVPITKDILTQRALPTETNKSDKPTDIVFDKKSGVTKVPAARRRHSIQFGDSAASTFDLREVKHFHKAKTFDEISNKSSPSSPLDIKDKAQPGDQIRSVPVRQRDICENIQPKQFYNSSDRVIQRPQDPPLPSRVPQVLPGYIPGPVSGLVGPPKQPASGLVGTPKQPGSGFVGPPKQPASRLVGPPKQPETHQPDQAEYRRYSIQHERADSRRRIHNNAVNVPNVDGPGPVKLPVQANQPAIDTIDIVYDKTSGVTKIPATRRHSIQIGDTSQSAFSPIDPNIAKTPSCDTYENVRPIHLPKTTPAPPARHPGQVQPPLVQAQSHLVGTNEQVQTPVGAPELKSQTPQAYDPNLRPRDQKQPVVNSSRIVSPGERSLSLSPNPSRFRRRPTTPEHLAAANKSQPKLDSSSPKAQGETRTVTPKVTSDYVVDGAQKAPAVQLGDKAVKADKFAKESIDISYNRGSGVTRIPATHRRHSIQCGDSSLYGTQDPIAPPPPPPTINKDLENNADIRSFQPTRTTSKSTDTKQNESAPKKVKGRQRVIPPEHLLAARGDQSPQPVSAIPPDHLLTARGDQNHKPVSVISPGEPKISHSTKPKRESNKGEESQAISYSKQSGITKVPATRRRHSIQFGDSSFENLGPREPLSNLRGAPLDIAKAKPKAEDTQGIENVQSPDMGVPTGNKANQRHGSSIYIRRPSISELTLEKAAYTKTVINKTDDKRAIHVRRHSVSTPAPHMLRGAPRPMLVSDVQKYDQVKQATLPAGGNPTKEPPVNHQGAAGGYLIPIRRYSVTYAPQDDNRGSTNDNSRMSSRQVAQPIRDQHVNGVPSGFQNGGQVDIMNKDNKVNIMTSGPVQISVSTENPMAMVGRHIEGKSTEFAMWTAPNAANQVQAPPINTMQGQPQPRLPGFYMPNGPAFVQNVYPQFPAVMPGAPWGMWRQGNVLVDGLTPCYPSPMAGPADPRLVYGNQYYTGMPLMQQPMGHPTGLGLSGSLQPVGQPKSFFSPLTVDTTSPGGAMVPAYGPSGYLLQPSMQNNSMSAENTPKAAHSQPFYGQPVNSQPFQGQTVNLQPFQRQTVNAQPFYGQTVNSQPFQVQTVNSQPFQVQTVNSQPLSGPPVNGMPGTPQLAVAPPQPAPAPQAVTPTQMTQVVPVKVDHVKSEAVIESSSSHQVGENGNVAPENATGGEEESDKWACDIKNLISDFENKNNVSDSPVPTEFGLSYGTPRKRSPETTKDAAIVTCNGSDDVDCGAAVNGTDGQTQTDARVAKSGSGVLVAQRGGPQEICCQTDPVPEGEEEGEETYELVVDSDSSGENFDRGGDRIEAHRRGSILRAYIAEMSISEVKY